VTSMELIRMQRARLAVVVIPTLLNRRLVICLAVVAVISLVITFPLGDAHMGLGHHSVILADLGVVFYYLFTLSVVALILLFALACLTWRDRSATGLNGKRENKR
jgi:hypothetical protein